MIGAGGVEVLAGPHAGKRVALETVLSVGSNVPDGLTLTDTAISRVHLELEPRPEGVRVRDLEDAIGEGLLTLDPLKAWTRAGMGPCQARLCGAPTAHLLSARTGIPLEALGGYRPRPPVKPVSVEALVAHDA